MHKREILKTGFFWPAIFLGTLFLSSCGKEDKAISGKVPDISLQNLFGKEVKVSEGNHKVQLLVFWATWCQPCIMEIPTLVELTKKYEKDGFKVLSINIDDPTGELVGKIYSEFNMNYEVLFGNEKTMSQFGGVQALPTSFIVDGKGKILEKIEGLMPEIYLEAKVKEYLEKL